MHAFEPLAPKPPHPATVAQAKPAFVNVNARPPHPATVAQAKPAFVNVNARRPHPAVAQTKPALHPPTDPRPEADAGLTPLWGAEGAKSSAAIQLARALVVGPRGNSQDQFSLMLGLIRNRSGSRDNLIIAREALGMFNQNVSQAIAFLRGMYRQAGAGSLSESMIGLLYSEARRYNPYGEKRLYNLTYKVGAKKPEEAAKTQSMDKSLRSKWPTRAPPRRKLEKGAIKAWLRKNTICQEAIKTPEVMKQSIEILRIALGDPGPRRPKDSKGGFARVSTVRIGKQSVTAGPIRKTTYKYTERYDYQQHLRRQNIDVSEACALISLQFLECTPCGDFLYGLLDTNDKIGGCRVYAHVDWYPERGYETVGFHKDTHGRTLFVGLIYMNDKELQGPDIIHNSWPLPDRDKSKKPTQQRYLPPLIKDPIDEILQDNTQFPMIIRQSGKIPAGGGIVWFVDELVHHSTPYQNHEKIHDKEGVFYLAIGGERLKEAGKTSGVKLSAKFDQKWDSSFNSETPRKFVRIWVTLE